MATPDTARPQLHEGTPDLRRPGVLSGVPLVTVAEAFLALQDACRPAGSGPTNVKVFVKGERVDHARHPLLPHADEGAADYLARASQENDFAVYCGSVQVHSFRLFERMRDYLARLFGPDWTPTGWLDAELFVGRYPFTPGGVHNEPRTNLHCVLDGQKWMMIWPPDSLTSQSLPVYTPSDRPDTVACPFILTGQAGDLLHWPAQYWHIGRSPELSISLNIAAYTPEPYDLVAKALAGEMHRRSAEEEEGAWRGSTMNLTPLAVQEQLKAVLDLVVSPGVRHSAELGWARNRSCSGFRAVPARREPVPLGTSDIMSRVPGAGLVWHVADDRLNYFGNGHSGTTQLLATDIDALKAIDSGRRLTVADLVQLVGGQSRARDARVLAEDLYTMRVLERATSSG